MEMDLSKTGYEMFFKDYQIHALQYLWRVGGGISRDVWLQVNTKLEGSISRPSISRASIINYLNDMVDNGILRYEERTGKGGHHRVYSHNYDEPQLREHLAAHVMNKLLKEFPEETRKAIETT